MSNSENQHNGDNTTLPFVSVVMPAHNEEKYIGECLSSLINQDYPKDRYEIIVVDNKSTDRTSEIAKSFGATVIFKENGPVGAVRNEGAKQAKGKIIAFIDSDCVAPKGWLSEAANLICRSPNTAFGGSYRLRRDPYWLEKYWLLEGTAPRKPPAELIGGTICIESQVFHAAGMFDETITSGEDSKLSITLRAKGFNVKFSDALDVIHLGNPTDSTTFFKRQIWHSENYLKDIRTSLHDRTFLLILSFYVGSLGCLKLALTGPPKEFFLCLVFLLLIPGIFSAKRIVSVQYRPEKLWHVAYIYYLDFIYIVARCVGITKSIIKLAIKKAD